MYVPSASAGQIGFVALADTDEDVAETADELEFANTDAVLAESIDEVEFASMLDTPSVIVVPAVSGMDVERVEAATRITVVDVADTIVPDASTLVEFAA